MKLRHFSPLLVFLLAALVLLPVGAQDGNGRGVVRYAGESLSDGSWALAPLLIPRLFDVDPVTGALLDASKSDRALVEVAPPDLPSDEVTLRLRSDRFWNDGEPITAYDVLFSLMAYSESERSSTVRVLTVWGVRLIDQQTIALRFARTDDEIAALPANALPYGDGATCDDLPRANLYLSPSHAASSDFRAFVDHHAPPLEQPSLQDWFRAYSDAGMPFPMSVVPTALTAGAYRRADSADETDRYVPSDGAGAVLETRRDNSLYGADTLIAGQTNVLLNVPTEQRSGLRSLAAPDAGNFQIAEVPGREALIVLLNFASTQRPLPGFHPVTGEPLDQGKNPLFSDLRVRRALQLAIDQQAIIDGALQQSAAPLAGLYPPGSWAFDPSLKPMETNVEAAKHLLDEAGWIDNGVVRRCVGCATAADGTQLRFTLGTLGVDPAIAVELTRQWARIGVSVIAMGDDSYVLQSQTFDAYLLSVGGLAHEQADPDPAWMLTPAGDVLSESGSANFRLNYGSYNNPDVTALIEQARALPGCDTAGRAALYHRMERILQEDLPFLPVAAPDEFYAAAPNVIGFAPRTGDPLWNVEDWVVAS